MTIEAGPGELFTTRAKPADVAALVALVNGAYRGESSRRGWTTETDLVGGTRIDAEALEETIAAPDRAVLVLRAQSGLLGCVEVQKQDADTAIIGMLTIRPTLQGSGLGRQMLAAAETFAHRDFGARQVELTVISVREELLAWYERRGYLATGEIRPFPYDELRLGVLKMAGLQMTVLRKTLAA